MLAELALHIIDVIPIAPATAPFRFQIEAGNQATALKQPFHSQATAP
jgi:hypothetical protein